MRMLNETTNKLILKDSEGYFKLHWDLLYGYDLDPIEALLLECIITEYSAIRFTKDVNGLTYKRLSDSFIQEMLDVTKHTIRECLNRLEDLGFIKIENANCKNEERYIYLNVEVVSGC